MDPVDWSSRRRIAWLVAGAALLAHGGCLRSTFYLDDYTQIIDTDAVDHGLWYTHRLRALTYFTYWLNWLAGGMSAPAFHAGNLLLHAVVSLTLLGFTREYLATAAGLPGPRADRIAGMSALLFAVHPLCSEIPNYVRARDIALVSEFALLAAWAAVRWRRDGRTGALLAAAGAIAAGMFCKEVGGIVAGGTALAAAFAARRDGDARRRRALGPGLVAVLGVCLIVAIRPVFFASPLNAVRASLTHPRLGWHVLTEARVFWGYAARVFLPLRLCSDHQIAWTLSMADSAAWVALAALLALAGAVASGLVRARPRSPECAVAALGAVVLLDVLHRLANVSGELMVEYRVYPAMTVLCILLAWGWDRLAGGLAVRGGEGWRRGLAWAGAGVIAAGIVLSALRTLDWRDAGTLAANVVAQYPLQARARQEVQEADLRAHHWQAALDRQPGIRQALDAAAAFNAAQKLRKYDPDLAALTRVSTEGNYAHALARLGRVREARAHLAWLRDAMEKNGLKEPGYWGMFYYASGQVHSAAGEKADALQDLRDSQELLFGLDFPTRESRRVERGEDG